MNNEYSYPLDYDWSTDEILHVMSFYQAVEIGYEEGILAGKFEEAYKDFKVIVPSKSEEKTLFKEYEKVSGNVPYLLIKQLKDAEPSDIIKP
ncbi:UPF0223 protein [Jeotgalicoccus coquinae]|uniref:Uncharacterized protein YktA (UPF0223 family) n=1 Tax=Jeotgalicoccus coquinae TaxID=709509 RepID=A0A6V7RKA3_9STAP|nr:UPF0223 family protein [Jeotgalicoccus coquinae]MBB6422486.1 uncharacterized protein YktA (UPF0223 family) [Jeotgalicoccus coquinae]GGE15499.1 UPF0223 protein [Jeotgalicoccus coquinae]CAD2078439.1 hypothetical protein JEOCOQ751_01173 [Jeotgalicoccus coquinae]